MLTDFDVTLSRFEKRAGLTQKTSPKTLPLIMVVDDNPGYRSSLVDVLSLDYRLVACSSGVEALERISDQVTTVVLDIKMPGLSGLDVCRELKKQFSEVPIIFNTGHPGEFLDQEIEAEFSPFGYVTKDSPGVLLALLKSAVKHDRLTRDYRGLIGTLEEKVAERTRELKESQAKLIQSERMASASRLVSSLSHQLKNPTVAIERIYPNLTGDCGELITHWLPEFISLHLETEESDALTTLSRDIFNRALERKSPTKLELLKASEPLALKFKEYGPPLTESLARDYARFWFEEGDIKRLALLLEAVGHKGLYAFLMVIYNIGTHLKHTKTSAEDISGNIQRVLNLSRKDRNEPVEDLSVESIIDLALDVLAYRLMNIEILKDYEPTPLLTGYPAALMHALVGLLENSIDAMDEAGQITIRVRPAKNEVVVSIIDRGSKGIPSEVQDVLFEPFTTTKDLGKGTGLGLYLAYQMIVKQHGGRIDCRSEPGRTEFIVGIPTIKHQADPPAL